MEINDNSRIEKCADAALTRTFFLSAGDCTAEKEISLTILTSKLIDIATEHANLLKIGNPYMTQPDCGWVLSRLTIEMTEYPEMDSSYGITTWVESWNKHFSERSFCITLEDGRVAGYARSVWMVLDTNTHANAGLAGLPFREDFISARECPIKRQAKHRLIILPGEPGSDSPKVSLASDIPSCHVFSFSDLDAYRHVNTVRYVALLMNQFPLEFHDAMRVSRLELSFLHEGEYGKEIEVLRSDVADNPDVSTFLLRRKIDKESVMYSRIFFKRR